MGRTPRKIKTIAIVAVILGLGVAAVVAVRRMDFSFLTNLSARSLVYVVPLFLLYQVGGIMSHALLLRDKGYRPGAVRLAISLFASYSFDLTGVTRKGTPTRVGPLRQVDRVPASIHTASTAVLYPVELAVTVVIALLGINMFFPEPTFRNVAWLVAALALIVTLAIFFHVSRRREHARAPRFGQRLTDSIAQVRDGMRRTTGATLAAVVGIALGKRLILAATSYLLLNGLGNPLAFKGILHLQSSAILVGFASMIPWGLGTRDLATFFLYIRLGLPPEVAAAITAIERILWTLAPFCLGLLCALLTGTRRHHFARRST